VSGPLGPGEAARRLGVSTRTVQRWLREGRLPAERVGGRLKVAASAFEPDDSAELVPPRPINRLLVANRGELVVRIARTCRRLGIASLALVADDQARAWWTRAADERVPLNGSYLDVSAVLDAAHASGADAVHPGYGFLAESADFAAAVIENGLTWVGPPPAAMRALGDKAAARRLAIAAGVPVLPGYEGDDQSDGALRRAARRLGYPLLVKPAGGGGGKGMHVVHRAGDLGEVAGRARREAKAAFDDERLILERYLERPRHIEIQLLCDTHGGAVHLGERECSLQRRHQKVIEESPSPAVDVTLRGRLGEAALGLARAAGYVGAGTAEFLLAEDGAFYFLELNARLQVEHPVTELITGRDLVADQLAVAAGQPLAIDQSEVRITGHAIEARLYAEDADAGFLPAAGEVLRVDWPSAAAGIRIDAGVGQGDFIGTRYDPLLAKVIAHAEDRATALARLDAALAECAVLGVSTNRGFLRWLLAQPSVRDGTAHTNLIDTDWRPAPELPAAAWSQASAALATLQQVDGADTRPAPGFRLNAPPRLRIEIDNEIRHMAVAASLSPELRWQAVGNGAIVLDQDGRSVRARLAPAPTVEDAVQHASHGPAASELVVAPMPGAVLEVRVDEGEQVEAGQVLVVLEAMKMENAISAPGPAVVRRVLAAAGAQVQRGDPLVELA
jgi:excisionase family DNA binding protein